MQFFKPEYNFKSWHDVATYLKDKQFDFIPSALSILKKTYPDVVVALPEDSEFTNSFMHIIHSYISVGAIDLFINVLISKTSTQELIKPEYIKVFQEEKYEVYLRKHYSRPTEDMPVTLFKSFDFYKSKGVFPQIAIAGHAGEGKDTLGNYLVCSRGYHKNALALPIKMACAINFRLTYEQLYVNKETIDPRYGVTPRYIMQKYGTEIMRKIVPIHIPAIPDDELWLLLHKYWLEDQLRINPKFRSVVVDCRSPFEANYLRKLGYLIVRVFNPTLKTIGEHVTETEVDKIEPDIVIYNNGKNLDQFYQVLEKQTQNIFGTADSDFDGQVDVNDKALFLDAFRNEIGRLSCGHL